MSIMANSNSEENVNYNPVQGKTTLVDGVIKVLFPEDYNSALENSLSTSKSFSEHLDTHWGF